MADHGLAPLAEAALGRHGDRDALWFEGEWHRSATLLERARRAAGGLRARGVRPGDRVVVSFANSPEVGIAYNAIWRAGAVVTPAIFLLSEAELRHVVEDSEAALVLSSAEEVRALEDAEPLPIVERDDSDLAALMYTGGTTGRAKGVMLTHENLWRAGKAGHDAGYVPGITRSLTALPLSHAFGLLVTVVGMHADEPSQGVLMRWFEPESWLEVAARHRTQIAAVVPSMIQLLLLQPLEDYDLSDLRYLASGGAALAAEVAQELQRRVPSVEVREGYGLTETAGLVSTTRPGRGRLGSVGEPVDGVEVHIVDERGAELPPGEIGEICCRSPLVMAGYWRAPDLTAEVTRGGWLHTGDLGLLDAEGHLHVVDRKKDLIIRGGFNVFPRDVEDALLEHPAVSDAGVVGRADERLGEEVVAFVALRHEVDYEELAAWARSRIGAHKYPREIHVLPSLPLTPVGKVDRKALRALAPVAR